MLFVSTYPGTLLKKGSKGESVKTLQQQLNARNYPCKDDGDFGDKTLECVI
jgi:peptidoglycan hydrolase-like protein with peptidoglycan-binding domain